MVLDFIKPMVKSFKSIFTLNSSRRLFKILNNVKLKIKLLTYYRRTGPLRKNVNKLRFIITLNDNFSYLPNSRTAFK